MPRRARKISSTKVYHVILRGNDRQDIFLDIQDYKKFIKEIKNTKEKYGYELYAYCLMSNHVHLVIYDKNNVLSYIMKSLELLYSAYFSKKYNRVGHLFQNRFLSKEIEEQGYLMQVCRYIHQNPVKAKISKIDKYMWSSFCEYISGEKLINTQMLLRLFGNNEKEAEENFKKFHNLFEDNINEEYEYELEGKLNDIELKNKIEKILNIKDVREISKYNTKIRDEKIRTLSIIKGVSRAQISRVLGMNKKTVERIMKQ